MKFTVCSLEILPLPHGTAIAIPLSSDTAAH
jgi:hypothetical protein